MLYFFGIFYLEALLPVWTLYAASFAAGLGVGLDGLAVSVKGDDGTYAWMCAMPGCAEAA